MHVFAVLNHKGGTGKTTTATTLSAVIARKGVSVLLIDADPQGHAAKTFDAPNTPGLSDLFMEEGLPFGSVPTRVEEGLCLVPAGSELNKAERMLSAESIEGLLRLAEYADAIADMADVVIIDTPPHAGTLSQNVMLLTAVLLGDHDAEGGLVVPVRMGYLDLDGLRSVRSESARLSRLGGELPIHAVIPTFTDSRTNLTRDGLKLLQEDMPARVLHPVRMTVRLTEAPGEARTIIDYAPDHPAADDYRTIAHQLMHGTHE